MLSLATGHFGCSRSTMRCYLVTMLTMKLRRPAHCRDVTSPYLTALRLPMLGIVGLHF